MSTAQTIQPVVDEKAAAAAAAKIEKEAKAAKAKAEKEAKAAEKSAADKLAADEKAKVAADAKVKADLEKGVAADKLKADKEAAKVAADLVKADKAAAIVAADAKKVADKEARKLQEQNGMTRPGKGTIGDRIWAVIDAASFAVGRPVTIAELRTNPALLADIPANVSSIYARWRKFNGQTGRTVAPAVAAPVA
jgi:hypothetical protein